MKGFHDTDGRYWPACDYLHNGQLVGCSAARIWVEEEGAGPPLLAIHGGPGVDHRSLHPGLSALADFRRVIYLDLRGHYMSPLPPGLPHNGLETDVADIEALRCALDLHQFDLFGHSYGGLVALAFAGRHPQSLRRLICCSVPIGATDEQIEQQLAADPASQALDAVQDQDSDAAFELYLKFYMQREPDATLRRMARLVRNSYASQRNAELLELREAADAVEPDWDALLAAVQCPALVLYGRRDPIVPVESLLAACRPHPGIEVQGFAQSRHDPFHDEPELFAVTVKRFLG